jgi:transglutaminase-like putative cysteine protease
LITAGNCHGIGNTPGGRKEGLSALNQRLFATTRYIIREVGSPHPAETTLREQEGSRRELAVLFCAACRAVGLAARFVSGYERDVSLQENGDLHA